MNYWFQLIAVLSLLIWLSLQSGCTVISVEITKTIHGKSNNMNSNSKVDGKIDQKVEDLIDATLPIGP